MHNLPPRTDRVACPDCDLLLNEIPLARGQRARCPRCGAILYRHVSQSVQRSLALVTASALFLVLANVYPLLGFELDGRVQNGLLLTGVVELYKGGMLGLAALVLLVSIVAPSIRVLGLLAVLLCVSNGHWSRTLSRLFCALHRLRSWSMVDVYILGLLVAIVKLSQLATIVPGVALWSFAALMVTLAAAQMCLEPRAIWQHAERCQ